MFQNCLINVSEAQSIVNIQNCINDYLLLFSNYFVAKCVSASKKSTLEWYNIASFVDLRLVRG